MACFGRDGWPAPRPDIAMAGSTRGFISKYRALRMKQAILARIIERVRTLPLPDALTTLTRTRYPPDYPDTKGDGRFCSTRCRSEFDAGLPAYDPGMVSKLE